MNRDELNKARDLVSEHDRLALLLEHIDDDADFGIITKDGEPRDIGYIEGVPQAVTAAIRLAANNIKNRLALFGVTLEEEQPALPGLPTAGVTAPGWRDPGDFPHDGAATRDEPAEAPAVPPTQPGPADQAWRDNAPLRSSGSAKRL